MGIEQHRLRMETGGMFIVAETTLRYLRPARLDDELIVTATLQKAGRASLTICQQAWSKNTRLCEGSIRIGWVTAHDLQPSRIPLNIIESLRATT